MQAVVHHFPPVFSLHHLSSIPLDTVLFTDSDNVLSFPMPPPSNPFSDHTSRPRFLRKLRTLRLVPRLSKRESTLPVEDPLPLPAVPLASKVYSSSFDERGDFVPYVPHQFSETTARPSPRLRGHSVSSYPGSPSSLSYSVSSGSPPNSPITPLNPLFTITQTIESDPFSSHFMTGSVQHRCSASNKVSESESVAPDPSSHAEPCQQISTNVQHERDQYSLEQRDADAAHQPSVSPNRINFPRSSPPPSPPPACPLPSPPPSCWSSDSGPGTSTYSRHGHRTASGSSDEDVVDRSEWVLSSDDDEDEGRSRGEDWTLGLGLGGYWYNADGDNKEKTVVRKEKKKRVREGVPSTTAAAGHEGDWTLGLPMDWDLPASQYSPPSTPKKPKPKTKSKPSPKAPSDSPSLIKRGGRPASPFPFLVKSAAVAAVDGSNSELGVSERCFGELMLAAGEETGEGRGVLGEY